MIGVLFLLVGFWWPMPLLVYKWPFSVLNLLFESFSHVCKIGQNSWFSLMALYTTIFDLILELSQLPVFLDTLLTLLYVFANTRR